MGSFAQLSPELIEQVLAATLEGPSRLDKRILARLGAVNQQWATAARRLALRWVTIDSPAAGARLLETIRNPDCASCVRKLVIKDDAFDKPTVFSELSQEDLLRLSTSLVAFDSSRAAFAPLADGRKPLPCYPSTLKSMRLGYAVTSPAQHYYTDEDEDDDDAQANQDEQRALKISATYLSLVRAFPKTLRSLKLSKVPANALPLFAPTAALDLPHLSSLELDMVSVPSTVFKWLTAASDFESVKVWLVSGVTEADLLDFAQHKGPELKTFAFKPKGKQGKRLANEMVCYMQKLERVTLGDKACDHTVWSNLPTTVTHICVAIPAHVQDARLPIVATEISTRLTNTQRLELYSGLYFAPPLEIAYPPADPFNSPDSGLRELRLSHISSPGLEAFVLRLGRGLYTLAVHHLSCSPESLTPYCPRLRRLEVGAADILSSTLPESFFGTVHLKSLTFLRVHFASFVSLGHLTASLGTIRAAQGRRDPAAPTTNPHRLATLELVGRFPGDLVGDDWESGRGIDALIEACRREEVAFCVNGRPVESVGDLWSAIQGQTGREAL